MCETVSRAGFYGWLTRGRSRRSRSDDELGARVCASFLASDRTYGARRVWHDLLADGLACGLHRIERLMRQQGAYITARPRRRRLRPRRLRLLLHDHSGPDPDAIVEVDDIIVGQPETARRRRGADGPRFIRAMDAVQPRAQIHGARAEWVVETTAHVTRGRSGRRANICSGGVQSGHSRLALIVVTPLQVKPARPTPMP
jgi:transposase InsO family protein